MADKNQNKTIGTTFIISGLGLAVSLGMTVGWIFASAGTALVIVGLVFLTKDEEEQ